jgi:hypothetical protein
MGEGYRDHLPKSKRNDVEAALLDCCLSLGYNKSLCRPTELFLEALDVLL